MNKRRFYSRFTLGRARAAKQYPPVGHLSQRIGKLRIVRVM